MLPILFITWLAVLPSGSGIINCRIACRRCREKLEHPDMLEVYCAMCDECKDRRREWLEGAPSLLRVENNDDYLTNYGTQDSQDDCQTTPIDEECDPPQLLTQTVPTTTTTTTTTSTTTSTTRKPCPPRPCSKPTRPPCPSVPCAIPMAIPVCPMCPMQMTGPLPYPMPFFPSSVSASITTEGSPQKLPISTTEGTPQKLPISATEGSPQKLPGARSATSELYFYLGVPKKLLKQLQLSKS